MSTADTAHLLVCYGSSEGQTEKIARRIRKALETYLEETDWNPDATLVAAGALQYSKYGLLKRLVVNNPDLKGRGIRLDR